MPYPSLYSPWCLAQILNIVGLLYIPVDKKCKWKFHTWTLSLFFFNFWILFNFLYSRFLLVIHFIHISVYMSIPISQFITPPPPATFPPCVHTFGTLSLFVLKFKLVFLGESWLLQRRKVWVICHKSPTLEFNNGRKKVWDYCLRFTRLHKVKFILFIIDQQPRHSMFCFYLG